MLGTPHLLAVPFNCEEMLMNSGLRHVFRRFVKWLMSLKNNSYRKQAHNEHTNIVHTVVHG